MEVKSIDKRTFQLIEEGNCLGKLIYESLYTHTARITIKDTGVYEMRPVGSVLNVIKDEEKILTVELNWPKLVTFSFQNGKKYFFKAQGVLFNKYKVDTKNQENLIQLHPKFNWDSTNYNYSISHNGKTNEPLICLLAVYASNYFATSMSNKMTGNM